MKLLGYVDKLHLLEIIVTMFKKVIFLILFITSLTKFIVICNETFY